MLKWENFMLKFEREKILIWNFEMRNFMLKFLKRNIMSEYARKFCWKFEKKLHVESLKKIMFKLLRFGKISCWPFENFHVKRGSSSYNVWNGEFLG